ncbi:hypothetical protein KCU90_g5252, partial [Aureobasidium melanogenum]
MLAADQVEHHVDRRRAARAGDAPRADFEQLLACVQRGIALAKGRQRLPMHGHAIRTAEEPGFRENEAARIDAAERRAAALEPLQTIAELTRIAGERLESRDHEYRLRRVDVRDCRIRIDRNAVAGRDRRAIETQNAPAVEIAAKAVRHAQRLDRRHEADRREARQQQERHIFGHRAQTRSGTYGGT